ncbi:MAG TPA: hypothetical protein VFN67_06355 [Polyangiales bacterium]|nr:hypothetical protein [Polyangiales bacterium]
MFATLPELGGASKPLRVSAETTWGYRLRAVLRTRVCCYPLAQCVGMRVRDNRCPCAWIWAADGGGDGGAGRGSRVALFTWDARVVPQRIACTRAHEVTPLMVLQLRAAPQLAQLHGSDACRVHGL